MIFPLSTIYVGLPWYLLFFPSHWKPIRSHKRDPQRGVLHVVRRVVLLPGFEAGWRWWLLVSLSAPAASWNVVKRSGRAQLLEQWTDPPERRCWWQIAPMSPWFMNVDEVNDTLTAINGLYQLITLRHIVGMFWRRTSCKRFTVASGNSWHS